MCARTCIENMRRVSCSDFSHVLFPLSRCPSSLSYRMSVFLLNMVSLVPLILLVATLLISLASL